MHSSPLQLLDTEHGDPGEEEMNSVAESVGSDSQYFDDLPSLHLRWKSESEEPLGLLWFQLLRFYTVEFQTPDHVISLKQSKVVERGKEWPGNRLALERECTHRHIQESDVQGNVKLCHPCHHICYVLYIYS